jgi:hypothetical protein
MIKNLLYGGLASSLVVLSACSDTFDPTGDSRQGRILPTVQLDKEIVAPKVKARAEGSATEIGVDDLTLTLTASSGQTYSFGVNEFPTNQDFEVGDYTLEASYGQPTDEGFDKPYYYGSNTLTVLADKVTPVEVTASLANAMVTVNYTDAVMQYFSQCNASVATSSGASFSYGADETRAVYVRPGTVNINVDVTKQNGVSAKLNPYSFTAEAQHHYIVTFDVNNGEVGAPQLVVTFNEALSEEQVELDLSDRVLTAPAPTIATTGFTSGETLSVVAGIASGKSPVAVVSAQAGLKTVVLTTTCQSLINQGWPAEVDFASADEATLAKLRALGLSYAGVTGTMSQMAKLDFTNVLAHIGYVDGGNNTSSFSLIAKDNYMKVSDAVEFNVSVSPLTVTIDNIESLNIDDTSLYFTLSYEGTHPSSELGVQLQNSNGEWATASATFTAASRSTNSYRVTVALPDGESDVVFRLAYGGAVSSAHTVKRVVAPLQFSVAANNVYAAHAYIDATTTDGSAVATALSNAKIYISTNGTAYTQVTPAVAASYLNVTGLKSATTYYLRGELDGVKTRHISFTTETATQVANGDLESWETTPSANQSSYNVQLPVGWGTMNYRTTSSGGVSTEYVRNNGTKPTTDAVSGTAALIRTVGWGNGNTAAGTASVVNHVTQGELYFGANPSDPNVDPSYNVAFTSRPSALTFKAKYTVGSKASGDKGYVEIAVYDSNGNVISSQTKEIEASTAYTAYTMPLTYGYGFAKAAGIKILFRSTNDIDTYVNRSHLTLPTFAVGTESVGSQLYVDDIALTY